MRCIEFQSALEQVGSAVHGNLSPVAVAKASISTDLAHQESPELFAKPKSVVFHGVKLGYQRPRERW